jgi:hypothetical protein
MQTNIQGCIELSQSSEILFNSDCVGKDDIFEIINLINNMTYYDVVNITSTNKSETFVPIKINIYKHINLLYLTDVNSNNAGEENIIKQLNLIKIPHLKVYLKYLYFNGVGEVNTHKDLYSDIKAYNSKFTIEELKDDEIINILIHDNNSNKSDINVFYNQDISQDIYSLNVRSNKFSEGLINIILLKMTNEQIKHNLVDKKYLIDFLSVIHSKKFMFHKLLIETLDNLETFNRFVMNYESIKTFDMVKEKVNVTYNIQLNIIQDNLVKFTLKGFKYDEEQFNTLSEVYVWTRYLLESNELVIFDHYFSFEFKY